MWRLDIQELRLRKAKYTILVAIWFSTNRVVARRRHICNVASLKVAWGMVDGNHYHTSAHRVPDIEDLLNLVLHIYSTSVWPKVTKSCRKLAKVAKNCKKSQKVAKNSSAVCNNAVMASLIKNVKHAESWFSATLFRPCSAYPWEAFKKYHFFAT